MVKKITSIMSKAIIQIGLILICALSFLPNVSAETSLAVQRCDDLAAHPNDPGRVSAGVVFNKINSELAISACTADVLSFPDVVRYKFQLGRAHDKDKNYTEAFKWYRKAADQGHVNAQFSLGVMYDFGLGVAEDNAEAFKWYRKAADQGQVKAQFNLGMMYHFGEGVAEDKAEAFKWYRKAADQGDADAQLSLGALYDFGEGVAEDKAEAFKWYRKAADQGHADAQFNLGVMYSDGEGVAEDNAEAFKWYRKAADQGEVKAQFNLGMMYHFGEGVAEDKAEAVKWYRKAADQGYAEAQFSLGVMYYDGEGVAEDKAEAFKWYRKAADQGDADAQLSLGVMYDFGEGVAEDKAEAFKWYRKAADQGDADAQLNLGALYDFGEGVAEDKAEAFKWYRKAADQGHADAQFNLGVMYSDGEGVAEDNAEAFKWYRKAADQGHASSQANLGALIISGFRPNQETPDEGFDWLKRGSDQGEIFAQLELFGALFSANVGGGKYDPKTARDVIEKAANNTIKSLISRKNMPGEAKYLYYSFLNNGYDGNSDLNEAINWLQKSVNEGYSLAKLTLAHRLWMGAGIAQDSKKAKTLFDQAALEDIQIPKFYDYATNKDKDKNKKKLSCEQLWSQNSKMSQPPARHWLIPIDVGFNANLIKLKSINTKDQTARAVIRVNYKFTDARYLFDPRYFGTFTCQVPAAVLWESQVGKMPLAWGPKIIALNGTGDSSSGLPSVSFHSKGFVEYRSEHIEDFEVGLDLRSFPFDVQNISLKFGSKNDNLSNVRLIEMEDTSSPIVSQVIDSDQEWVTIEENIEFIHEQRGQSLFSVAALDLKIKRNPNYYIFKIIIPLFLLFLVSTSQFWLKWDRLDARVSIAISSLVAVIAYQFLIQGDLPKLPYLTMLDKLILLTFMLIVLGIAELVLVFSLLNMDQKKLKVRFLRNLENLNFTPRALAEKIDRHSRYFFPVFWLISSGVLVSEGAWLWAHA